MYAGSVSFNTNFYDILADRWIILTSDTPNLLNSYVRLVQLAFYSI